MVHVFCCEYDKIRVLKERYRVKKEEEERLRREAEEERMRREEEERKKKEEEDKRSREIEERFQRGRPMKGAVTGTAVMGENSRIEDGPKQARVIDDFDNETMDNLISFKTKSQIRVDKKLV